MTKPRDTYTARHALMIDALISMEEAATTIGNPGAGDWNRREARRKLCAAALLYASRVRSLARVR